MARAPKDKPQPPSIVVTNRMAKDMAPRGLAAVALGHAVLALLDAGMPINADALRAVLAARFGDPATSEGDRRMAELALQRLRPTVPPER